MIGQLNKRFNRTETDLEHYYLDNTQPRCGEEFEHAGYLKCKLVHGQGFSIVIPDLILLETPATVWIQPLMFLPNAFLKSDNSIAGRFYMDISCGQTLQVDFKNSGYLCRYADGSELFECTITGPQDLHEYSTGEYEWGDHHQILLHLYHHTTESARESILESGSFRLSQWNIQGNKRLKNIGYVYFTCLPEIKRDGDLHQIAMASNGTMHLIIDGVPVPPVLREGDLNQYRDQILELEVYRENTHNRQATILLKIDAGYLSPQHILWHCPPAGAVYYEVARPFIYRIGLPPNEQWSIDPQALVADYTHVKRFDYVVIGTATSVAGLRAPYDEEETKEIAKVQATTASGNMLDFWFDEANSDHFSRMETTYLEIEEGQP